MVRTSYQNEFSQDAAMSEYSNGSYQGREVMESGNCEWILTGAGFALHCSRIPKCPSSQKPSGML